MPSSYSVVAGRKLFPLFIEIWSGKGSQAAEIENDEANAFGRDRWEQFV